jgi:DNA replicative helicase MCM subunit Mcm2 (Cdc46/Mcm family)
MTTQRKQFISLGEILAFVLECKNCHAQTVNPLDEKFSQLPGKCPNCERDFLKSHPSTDAKLKQIVDLVRELKKVDKQEDEEAGHLPFLILIEIAPAPQD